jgi:hypothetical protein
MRDTMTMKEHQQHQERINEIFALLKEIDSIQKPELFLERCNKILALMYELGPEICDWLESKFIEELEKRKKYGVTQWE